MLSAALFERAIAWAASAPRAPALDRARAEFERRTGPIVSGAKDFEARIAHFFEQALCAPLAPDQTPWIADFAAETALSAAERRELAGWLRSYRSLWKFESSQGSAGQVRDLIGGARFRFVVVGADRELRSGDCFDGRLVALGTALCLSSGRVFHPQAAQHALQILLSEAQAQGTRNASLLDPLLGMRSRLIGFESIRAEHVYRLDALDAQGLAAPWARASNRQPSDREHT
jgi:hypothetical protein